MSVNARYLCAALLASTTLLVLDASAQSQNFYLDRAQLSGAPDDGFMVWRPQLYDESRFYGTAALGYTLNPLRADTVANSTYVTNNNMDTPVEGQFTTYLMAGAQISGRAGVGVSLPITMYQYGTDAPDNTVDSNINQAIAIHDLRLDGRFKVYESDARTLRLGLGAAVWAPTGDSRSYTGDDQMTGWLFGNGEYDFGKLLVAGQIGPHFRPQRSIAGANASLDVSSELRWAAGAYMPLRDGELRLGLELWGTTGMGSANGQSTFFATRNTDIEWLGQARMLLDKSKHWYGNAGVGTRLTAGYGAPDMRLLVSVGYWFQIKDEEPKSPHVRYTGTPTAKSYAKDTDGDGYPDDIDKCPDVKEDGKEPAPSDGCPAGMDRDGDGIPDVEDACPDVPEDKDGIQDEDGCPEEDADSDKIPDTEDRCPTVPGPRNDIAERNGCPSLTRFEEGSEIQLLEPIQFDTGKATIKPVSFPILDEVVALMKARMDVKIAVHGHTDSVGSDASNLKLSKDRAASVMKYLVDHGISPERLQSEGFGETKPIESNDTAEGRLKNRRVEFKVVD